VSLRPAWLGYTFEIVPNNNKIQKGVFALFLVVLGFELGALCLKAGALLLEPCL
jgi:hypothetical protein